MKTLLPFLFLLLLLLIAFVAQDTLSSIQLLGQAPLLFVPTIFCFSALAFTLPEALLFALITAILSYLMIAQFPNGHTEIKPGWFLFFFIGWTILLQFLSDLTDGVRWELHAIGSALCTATLLFGEFFILSLKRGHFLITERIFILILVPAGASLLIAPLFYCFLQFFLLPTASTPSVKRD